MAVVEALEVTDAMELKELEEVVVFLVLRPQEVD